MFGGDNIFLLRSFFIRKGGSLVLDGKTTKHEGHNGHKGLKPFVLSFSFVIFVIFVYFVFEKILSVKTVEPER